MQTMFRTLILLVIVGFSALSVSGQTLTEEQRETAANFLKRVKDATSLALQGVGNSDYKLAVDVAGYYENDLSTLPAGQVRILLTRIYLSHLDALVAWALYNGADPSPMFSLPEFQRNLLTRYGIRARITRGNRPARDTALRTIWRIQTTWEQNVFALISPYRVTTRNVPPEFTQAFEFLEFIKFPNEPKGVFNPQAAPHWNASKFMIFIAANGVTFSDVNRDTPFHGSRTQIQASLMSRRGEIFSMFSHLAMIYSIPYKQYSELSFEKTNNEFVVNVGDSYRLTFMSEGASLRLTKCDYLMVEGD
jgi:hypothetical protein